MQFILNGEWRAKPDPAGDGERNRWFDIAKSDAAAPEWEPVEVPSCWNSDPRYDRYEGLFWYAVDFPMPEHDAGETEPAIRFGAVNYFCRAWLNGLEIGSHEGGYLPFEFEIDPANIKKNNRLVVLVDNLRSSKRIPGEVFDWYNYGGIVRDVVFFMRRPLRFESVRVSGRPIGASSAEVTVDFKQTESFGFKWRITPADGGNQVAAGTLEQDSPTGRFIAGFRGAKTWSPESPNLYNIELEPLEDAAADPYVARFGVREIRIDGTKILLNGDSVKLRGVSLHEELEPYGRAIPAEERARDVADIKKLGFNALRTAHYTHDEALLDAADEAGLLVFEEIPVYWEIDYEDPRVYALARSMLRDMTERDFNHPCVILWSVGNEVPVEHAECADFIRALLSEARALDPTRLAAFVSCRFLIDSVRPASDIAGVNCYLGWYYGDEKDLAGLMELMQATAPDKPWIMTEFGACARRDYRSKAGAKYSEDRQADLLAHYIRTLNSLDFVNGWFIWIYRDFRSPLRTHPRQQGFNRKGIVDEKRQPKLSALRLPGLMEEMSAPRSKAPFAALRSALLAGLENFVYKAAFPLVTRSQRQLTNRYYLRRPE